jgi:hypothetical protein
MTVGIMSSFAFEVVEEPDEKPDLKTSYRAR